MSALRIKKGDTVRVTSGQYRGEQGVVVSTDSTNRSVTIDGIGIRKRHVKPTRLNPRGGTRDIHQPINSSNVVLLVDDKPTRISYAIRADGTKSRLATNLKKKEIK